MVRGPKSGNGTRSSVYYLGSAGLASPRPRPRALDSELALDGELDPLVADMQADGSLAARPGIAGSWRGAGGRWLLWPLRVVLWTALVVVAFRGITAIISGSSPAPAGGTGAANTAREFPVSLAEAYATEFGRVTDALRTAPVTDRRVRDYSRVLFASASNETPDGQGRITVLAERPVGEEPSTAMLKEVLNGLRAL